jgi:glycosyltransferase involved in cell wall biosynthesis
MLRDLRSISKEHDLVICRSDLFDWIFVLLLAMFVPRASIVVFHHGGKFEKPKTLKKLVSHGLLKYSYSKINTATYLRIEAREWMLTLKKHPSLVWLPVGADFSVFTPQDKQTCRKDLGLDQHKIYAVYVGRMFRLNGVDVILDLSKKHRSKNFEVLFVGANVNDELYDDVKASGNMFWHRVDWLLLRKIYSAADFYIHPAFHPKFGGLDVSLMECLACGTPVLSPQLAEYDFDATELGICVNTLDDFDFKLQEMMGRYCSFQKCREVAINHLDGNGPIIDKLHALLNAAGDAKSINRKQANEG